MAREVEPLTPTERLWLCSRFLPESALRLGKRYRAMFLVYANGVRPGGKLAVVADAMAFAEFSTRQRRVALNPAELATLRREARRLRRRYRLARDGAAVTAVEKGALRRWLGL
ncbi:MAG: hypothetical protein PHF00_10780 [Elusimicrobia bacterium]|nr:hypothetical protein [Elusimicrobiota bacterium]